MFKEIISVRLCDYSMVNRIHVYILLILESYVQAEAAGSCHRIDLTVDAAQHFGCEAVIAGEIGQIVAGEVDSQILHGYLLHP